MKEVTSKDLQETLIEKVQNKIQAIKEATQTTGEIIEMTIEEETEITMEGGIEMMTKDWIETTKIITKEEILMIEGGIEIMTEYLKEIMREVNGDLTEITETINMKGNMMIETVKRKAERTIGTKINKFVCT